MRTIIRLLDQALCYITCLIRGGPNYLIFFVTARCNLRCPHCFYLEEINSAVSSKELKINELEQMTKKAPFLFHVSFTGGETFVRNDIDKIVRITNKFA